MRSESQQNTTSTDQRRKEQEDFERLMKLPRINQSDVNTTSMMFDPLISRRVHVFAKMLSEGKVAVPEYLRGNFADCVAIVMQAASWGLNPFSVAEKTHLIHGRICYEAQLVSAVVSSLGILEGRFSYEYGGDWKKIQKPPRIVKGNRGDYPVPGWKPEEEEGLTITVIGKLLGDSEPKKLDPPLALATVWPRNSTLWATSPQQQIAYLATKQWVRRFAPDSILGVYTPDEIAQEELADVSSASAEVMKRARALDQQEQTRIAKARELENVDMTYMAPEQIAEMENMRKSPNENIREPARKQTSEADEPAQSGAPAVDKPPQSENDGDEWPQERNGVLVDCRGVPWHQDLYSARKTCTDAGTWRKRRGASQTDIDRHEARYLKKTQTGGTAKIEKSILNTGGHGGLLVEKDDPPQAEQRTVEHHATEQEMRKRINRSTSSAELEEHMAKVDAHPGWDDTVKLDLLELARGHHADWLEVERQERENQQQEQQGRELV